MLRFICSGTQSGALMETKPVNSSHWYLLTGLVLGLVVGLVISLFIAPAVNADALPHELDEAGKAVYREQIALAYASNHALNRALSRLDLLKDEDPAAALIAQAQAVVAARRERWNLSRALSELGTAVQELCTASLPLKEDRFLKKPVMSRFFV